MCQADKVVIQPSSDPDAQTFVNGSIITEDTTLHHVSGARLWLILYIGGIGLCKGCAEKKNSEDGEKKLKNNSQVYVKVVHRKKNSEDGEKKVKKNSRPGIEHGSSA